MSDGSKLVEQIADDLTDAGIDFKRQVAIGGVQPDFVVEAPDGRRFVIEVKAWKKSPGIRKRAEHQADLYRENVGADLAFLVVGALERSRVPLGVVTTDKLIPALQEALAEESPPVRRRKPALKTELPHVFVAMPFAPKYDDVYFLAMVHAVKSNNAVCQRVDQIDYAGDIVLKTEELIRDAVAVIVDLSEAKPNVLYEAGYSHALLKPVVHICSTPIDELPFNVAHWPTIPYRQGQIHRLRRPLTKRLKELLA